jgi:hypothetical protein
MIGIKVNCIYNDNVGWCKNKNVKRSLFGIGARVCPLADGLVDCPHQEKYPRANRPPRIKRRK